MPSCNIVINRKLDDQGRVVHLEPCIVANFYIPQDCVNRNETFAATIQFDVLLLVVGKITSVGWPVHRADISNAFLNTDIDSRV